MAEEFCCPTEAIGAGDFDFDFDYEFDAPTFCDFARSETESEAREAELWFDSAGSHPPSPFVIKLRQRIEINVENEESSSGSGDDENMNCSSDEDREVEVIVKNKSEVKTYVPRSSTLLKPTLSHLAKQVQFQDADSKLLRRFQKLLVKLDKKGIKPSPSVENQYSKRQKLEAGYLRKVAHLKHQALFIHKTPEKGESLDSVSSRNSTQVTIPKGPDLETARRAQRWRSKTKAELKEDGKSNPYVFKARSLNRKILQTPSLPFPKRSTPLPPQFQVFHLRTSERAKLKGSNAKAIPNYVSASRVEIAEPGRLRSFGSLKEDKHTVHASKACPLNKILSSKRETGCNTQIETTLSLESTSAEQRLQSAPPAELFSQMTLSIEVNSNAKPLSTMEFNNEGTKENAPGFLLQPESLPKTGGARYKCSTGRSTEIGARISSKRY